MARATVLIVSDQDVRALGGERAPEVGPRMVPREVDDDVVALAGPGEVLLRVVDDRVRADRPERVQLPGGIHTGHVRSVCLGELHREGPYGPSGTVDQDPLSRPDSPLIANALHRDRSG